MSILQRNKEIYEALIEIFNLTDNELSKLELSKLIGQIAFKFHSGKFRESVIEDFLSAFSNKNLQLSEGEPVKSQQRNVVHVFTTLYETGGHVRLAENLIGFDKFHTHHVYVTNQGESKVPSDFHNNVLKQSGLFVLDNNSSDLLKAKSLFEFVLQHRGKIFLHIHPDDVIPSLAFNTHKDSLDIFFVNHADHAFSYGLDVSSCLINIREEAQNISIAKRNFRNCFVLPLPLRKNDIKAELRDSLRTEHGIADNELLGVCIGSGHKFKPNKCYDFFKTIHGILLKNANLKIVIIGLDQELANKHNVKVIEHPRLSLKGIVNDPSEYQIMADIAIDPMPIGSYTALLETAYYGAYPVVCYNPNPLFDLSRDPALVNIISVTMSEEEYKEHFNFLCSNPDFLAKNRDVLSKGIYAWHSGEKWLEIYTNILNNGLPKKDSQQEVSLNSISYDEELANLNPGLNQQERIILSYFYSHSDHFSFTEILKITRKLWSLKFRRRDLLAITKKSVLNSIHKAPNTK